MTDSIKQTLVPKRLFWCSHLSPGWTLSGVRNQARVIAYMKPPSNMLLDTYKCISISFLRVANLCSRRKPSETVSKEILVGSEIIIWEWRFCMPTSHCSLLQWCKAKSKSNCFYECPGYEATFLATLNKELRLMSLFVALLVIPLANAQVPD